MIKNMHISLFEQGKIKIGKKGAKKSSSKGTEYREAIKLDYFIITTLERDVQDNFKIDSAAMKDLGKEPTQLPIELLFDDIELNFPTCYAMYSQKDGLLCRGDGETAITAKQENIVCNPDTCPHAQNKNCKPSGILSCRLPHLKTLGGVYKFRTHSWNSIKNILASLQYLATLTGGVLAGLPLELRTEKKPTRFGLVNIVNIVFPGTQDTLADALEKEISRRQRLQIDVKNIETIARKTGVIEDDDDPIDVAEEFFPLKEDGEYPSTAEMLEGWELAAPDTGNGENMPVQSQQKEKQKDWSIPVTWHQHIRKLWEYCEMHPAHGENHFKKAIRESGAEEVSLSNCQDVSFMKVYADTLKRDYDEAKAEKEAIREIM